MAGYRRLPVSDLPNVDYPTIQVQVNLPGANPDTMAAAVALPLEKQFSTIAGLDSMSSQNFLGKTNITLQFVLNRDIDGASQDVQAAITQASRQLPQNLPAPPSFYKLNPADYPVLFLVLSSPTLPLSTVDEYAETLIAQSISTVNGVAQVQVMGRQKYAVRVQVDPQAMATRQIGIDEVEQALKDGNVSLPTGTLWGPHQAVNVEATGQLFTAPDYAPLIVAYRNGSPVRLSDVGRVIDGVENDKTAAWYNGVRGIQLAIYRQPGTNAVEVVDNVKAMLPDLAGAIASSGQLDILVRPLDYDPKFRGRREVHPGAGADPGGNGYLPLPAESSRDHDPQPGPAVLDCRNLRGDVSVRLFARQPLDDGADAIGGICGGRRDRDAGKHRPPPGEWRRRS